MNDQPQHDGQAFPAFQFPPATEANIWPQFEVRNTKTADDISELITFVRKQHEGIYYLVPMRYLLAAPRGFGAISNFKLVTQSVHHIQQFYKLDEETRAKHVLLDPDQRPEAERITASNKTYPQPKAREI